MGPAVSTRPVASTLLPVEAPAVGSSILATQRRTAMKKGMWTVIMALVLAASVLLVVPTFESESMPMMGGIGMADDGP